MRKMLTISVGLRLHSQLQIHTTKSSNLKYIQCLTSSPANFASNFQIHFSLEIDGGFDQTQLLMKA